MEKSFTNWFKAKKRGETLLEVLIAVAVVAMGAATSSSLIVQSLRSNQYSKDTLQALNLAKEGLEMMRVVRNTNWMKFSADTDNCWNVFPNEAVCDAPNNLIDEGFYALGYTLSSVYGTDLNVADGISANDENYRLSYYDYDPGADANGDTINDNDREFVGSNGPGGSAIALDGTEEVHTKFYRSIQVVYKTANDVDGELVDPTTPVKENGNIMMIVAKVQWQVQGGQWHQITLSSALSKYK
jgi:prepilin-type N-terminal cleavage/methylation domain-containing protein